MILGKILNFYDFKYIFKNHPLTRSTNTYLNILACFFNNCNLPLVILHRLILLLSLSKIDLRVEFGCKQKLLISTMFQKSTSIRNILLLLHLWNISLLIAVIFLTIANLGSYIYIHTHICKF